MVSSLRRTRLASPPVVVVPVEYLVHLDDLHGTFLTAGHLLLRLRA